jgi:hypothetical protein
MTTSYLSTFYMTTFYHRKIEKHYQAWKKSNNTPPKKVLETTGKSNNRKGASVLLLQFPPPGSVGPTGSPRAGSRGFRITLDLRSAPTPSSPSQPSRPPPPLQGPPVPSPPSSKVVVLGLQVESRFFYPVIINLVYPILFSPLSRVATIRLELPSRGVGGP